MVLKKKQPETQLVQIAPSLAPANPASSSVLQPPVQLEAHGDDD
jgi:hypothetical protein